jgi:hypothetical protein
MSAGPLEQSQLFQVHPSPTRCASGQLISVSTKPWAQSFSPISLSVSGTCVATGASWPSWWNSSCRPRLMVQSVFAVAAFGAIAATLVSARAAIGYPKCSAPSPMRHAPARAARARRRTSTRLAIRPP